MSPVFPRPRACDRPALSSTAGLSPCWLRPFGVQVCSDAFHGPGGHHLQIPVFPFPTDVLRTCLRSLDRPFTACSLVSPLPSEICPCCFTELLLLRSPLTSMLLKTKGGFSVLILISQQQSATSAFLKHSLILVPWSCVLFCSPSNPLSHQADSPQGLVLASLLCSPRDTSPCGSIYSLNFSYSCISVSSQDLCLLSLRLTSVASPVASLMFPL